MPSSLSGRPYDMCSVEECQEREEQHQVSVFEATVETRRASPKFRQINPCWAVAKYRRSAAGTAVRPPRSLSQLERTWNHLKSLVVEQSLPPTSSTAEEENHLQQESLLLTVAFVDDRVRALQVDLVVSQKSHCRLQAELVRYHLLSLYLLSKVDPKQYEPKFGRQALRTALSAYWNENEPSTLERNPQEDDEILCLTALLHVCNCLVQEAQGDLAPSASTSSGYGAVLLLALQQQQHDHNKGEYPKFQWALRLAHAAHMGFYRIVLSLLANSVDLFGEATAVLCKCCMAPALNAVRTGALQHYNKAFGKREAIAGTEMARLLYLPSSQAALDFCASLGLPIEDDCVLMKAAPISTASLDKATTRRDASRACSSRPEDDFVFGTFSPEARVDQDGVAIPPPELLTNLLNQKC